MRNRRLWSTDLTQFVETQDRKREREKEDEGLYVAKETTKRVRLG